MPIIKDSYGRHKDVHIIEFGSGDIYITKAVEEGMPHENVLCLSKIPGFNIGDVDGTYQGKSIDKLPNLSVVLRFNKPESITALIQSLVELQIAVFKNQTAQ